MSRFRACTLLFSLPCALIAGVVTGNLIDRQRSSKQPPLVPSVEKQRENSEVSLARSGSSEPTLAEKVAGSQSSDIRALLSSVEQGYWESDPSAFEALKLSGQRWRDKSGLNGAVMECSNFLQSIEKDSRRFSLLATAGFAGCIKPSEDNENALAEVIQLLPASHRDPFIESCAVAYTPRGVGGAFSLVVRLASAVGGELTAEHYLKLAQLVAEFAPSQNPAELIDLCKKHVPQKSQGQLIKEMLKWQLVLQRGALDRSLEAVAQQFPDALGKAAFEAGISPATLKGFLEKLDERAKANAIGGYLDSIVEKSPIDLLGFADVFGAPELPRNLQAKIAVVLLGVQPGYLANWFKTLPAKDRGDIIEKGFIQVVSQRMPLEAALFYLEQAASGVPLSKRVLATVVAHGCQANFEKTFELLKRLPEADQLAHMEAAFSAHASVLGRKDASGIEKFIQRAPEQIRTTLQITAYGEWAKTDFAKALAAVKGLEGVADRDALMGAILGKALETQPPREVEKTLVESIQSAQAPKAFQSAIDRLAESYASMNPKLATDFLQRLPAGELKDAAIPKFATYWAKVNPDAAASWIESLPAGTARDQAVSKFVAAAKDDPEHALASTLAITDTQTRVSAASEIIKTWKTVDRHLTKLLVDQTPFSDSDRLILLQLLEEKTGKGNE